MYASAEAAVGKKFLTILKCNPAFLKEIVAMIDEIHTVETWMSLRY